MRLDVSNYLKYQFGCLIRGFVKTCSYDLNGISVAILYLIRFHLSSKKIILLLLMRETLILLNAIEMKLNCKTGIRTLMNNFAYFHNQIEGLTSFI